MVGFWEWRIWDELVVASKTDLVGPVVVGVSDSVWIRVFPRHRLLASMVVGKRARRGFAVACAPLRCVRKCNSKDKSRSFVFTPASKLTADPDSLRMTMLGYCRLPSC